MLIMDNQAITIRRIEEKDNREIAEVIRTVFREFKIDKPGTVYFDPTTDDLYELFRKPGCAYWIAEEDGKITGGCGIYSTPGLPDGCAELVKLYLLPEHRGKGIGRMLMEKTFKSARDFGYRQLYLESMHFCCDIWMVRDL
jgi:putative acetyltransferase